MRGKEEEGKRGRGSIGYHVYECKLTLQVLSALSPAAELHGVILSPHSRKSIKYYKYDRVTGVVL